MPIRPLAAKALAQSLFQTYLERGLITEIGVDLVASIIKNAVDIDEAKQQIERLEEQEPA